MKSEYNNIRCQQQVVSNKDIARLCKGSTTDSDSVCLGSNPSRAAIKSQSLRLGFVLLRGIAQFGSVLGSGPRGRGFKSRYSDQIRHTVWCVLFFISSPSSFPISKPIIQKYYEKPKVFSKRNKRDRKTEFNMLQWS